MVIKTKYNVGDEVWFLKRNKVVSDVIDHICMKVHNDQTLTMHYHFAKSTDGKATLRTEDYLFSSREELISELESGE